jgi:hypothetical protein
MRGSARLLNHADIIAGSRWSFFALAGSCGWRLRDCANRNRVSIRDALQLPVIDMLDSEPLLRFVDVQQLRCGKQLLRHLGDLAAP